MKNPGSVWKDMLGRTSPMPPPALSPCCTMKRKHCTEELQNCLSGGHFDDVVEVKEEGHVEVSDPHVEVDNETCEDKNCYHI